MQIPRWVSVKVWAPPVPPLAVSQDTEPCLTSSTKVCCELSDQVQWQWHWTNLLLQLIVCSSVHGLLTGEWSVGPEQFRVSSGPSCCGLHLALWLSPTLPPWAYHAAVVSALLLFLKELYLFLPQGLCLCGSLCLGLPFSSSFHGWFLSLLKASAPIPPPQRGFLEHLI